MKQQKYISKSISIFLPMYNEEKTIEKTLTKVVEEVSNIAKDYEIIVINDGSFDSSLQKVRVFIESNPNIRVINNPGNQGYGFSLRMGFCNATKDLIFYTDCDLPVDFESLRGAIPYTDDFDLVVGYRKERIETFRRKIYSLIYNFMVRKLFNVHVKDVNFSFKLVRKVALDNIELTANSVFIDGQLLAEVTRKGFKIKEIPIDYTPRAFGASNFDKVSYAVKTFLEIIHYFFLLKLGLISCRN